MSQPHPPSRSHEPTGDDALSPEELLYLPPAHPARVALEQRLALMNETDRASWMQQLEEADALRGSLSEGPDLSPDFSAKLHQIPNLEPSSAEQPSPGGSLPLSRWRRAMQQPVGWQHLAALLAVGLLAGIIYYIANREPAPPTMLADREATVIAEAAAEAHIADVPLAFASADADAVLQTLTKQTLPFTPAVLTPTSDVKLLGEAVVSVKGVPAVLTRWRRDAVPASPDGQPTDSSQAGTAGTPGATWSLYQFKGGTFDTPTSFLETSQVVQGGSAGGTRKTVTIWPGSDGTCLWALVVEGEKLSFNPFGGGYSYGK